MRTIFRRSSEGIVIDGQTRVTVVEVNTTDVTLDITDPDGSTKRVTLACSHDQSRLHVCDDTRVHRPISPKPIRFAAGSAAVAHAGGASLHLADGVAGGH